jgi:hypothetical protein
MGPLFLSGLPKKESEEVQSHMWNDITRAHRTSVGVHSETTFRSSGWSHEHGLVRLFEWYAERWSRSVCCLTLRKVNLITAVQQRDSVFPVLTHWRITPSTSTPLFPLPKPLSCATTYHQLRREVYCRWRHLCNAIIPLVLYSPVINTNLRTAHVRPHNITTFFEVRRTHLHSSVACLV